MNLIMKCLFGSHLYQCQTENSDKDYKGIYLPTRDSLLLGNYAKHYSESTGNDKSKNTRDDVDIEIFSLPYFIDLACKGETVALDMLHAKDNLAPCVNDWSCYLDDIWDDLQHKRQMFYTKDMKSYIGYARKQANKYGIKGSRMGSVEKVLNYLTQGEYFEYNRTTTIRDVYNSLPTDDFLIKCGMTDKSQAKELVFYEVCGRKYQDTLTLEQLLGHVREIYKEYGDRARQAKDNVGVDFKAVHHALRASYQMLGILKDGDFEYPLPQTEFLLAVKKGELNFVKEVQPELDNLIITIEKMSEESNLPRKVDREYWDNWLLGVYREYL